MHKDTAIIGIGGAGCKILSKANVNAEKYYFDTDKEVCEKYSGFRVGEKTCGEYSASGNISLAELSVRESKITILEKIKNFKKVIIVAPLGGGTSCGASKRILDLCVDNGIKVIFLTSMPFEIEGNQRLHKAVESISYIEKICEVKVIGKKFYKNTDKKMSLNDIFNLQDEYFLAEIDNFCV